MACKICGGIEEIIKYEEDVIKDYFTGEYKKIVYLDLRCFECGNERQDNFKEDVLM